MRRTTLIAAALTLTTLAAAPAHAAQYIPTIQQRWDTSDLVCIGDASAPARTGVVQTIDGSDRDQLSARIEIEACLKGDRPAYQEIRVLGDSVVAAKAAGPMGFAYAGPPAGFVSEGRNLLFLRRTDAPDEFVVTVPIYETAIHLADSRPAYPSPAYPSAAYPSPDPRDILTRELEAALIQFDEGDLSYISYLSDLLGPRDVIAELERLSPGVPLPVQRDIAVTLLTRKQQDSEPVVLSLLLDTSALPWKRANAASALGEHGTNAALAPLQEVASQPAPTENLKQLQFASQQSLSRLQHRLSIP